MAVREILNKHIHPHRHRACLHHILAIIKLPSIWVSGTFVDSHCRANLQFARTR
jgi:hypothetical protein